MSQDKEEQRVQVYIEACKLDDPSNELGAENLLDAKDLLREFIAKDFSKSPGNKPKI